MRPRLSQLHASGATTTGQAVVWNQSALQWEVSSGAALVDPSTTKGDLLARSSSALARLAVGSNGQVLTADSAQTLGVAWATLTALTDPTTTKGDLITRTSSAITRRAVGGNGQVLTADSAETDGVKWATPSAGSASFKGCRVYKAATQTIADNTETSLLFDTEEYDTDAYHSTVTNTSRITIPSGLDGYYRFNFEAYWNAMPSPPVYWVFKKNGTTEVKGRRRQDTTAMSWISSSVTVNLAATDYIEVRVLHVSGGDDIGTSVYETVLEAHYLGA